MFDLKDFVDYDGSNLSDSHSVLVWSLKTGYFFTHYSDVKQGERIVGMM